MTSEEVQRCPICGEPIERDREMVDAEALFVQTCINFDGCNYCFNLFEQEEIEKKIKGKGGVD